MSMSGMSQSQVVGEPSMEDVAAGMEDGIRKMSAMVAAIQNSLFGIALEAQKLEPHSDKPGDIHSRMCQAQTDITTLNERLEGILYRINRNA